MYLSYNTKLMCSLSVTQTNRKHFLGFGWVKCNCKCLSVNSCWCCCCSDRYHAVTLFCSMHRLRVFFPSFWPSNTSKLSGSSVLVAMLPVSKFPSSPPTNPLAPSRFLLGKTMRGYTGVFQLLPKTQRGARSPKDRNILRSHTA